MPAEFIHFLRYLSGLDPAASQTTPAERTVIARHAAGKRALVEIGVFEGLTTGVIGRAMAADGVLYGIDPFIPGRLGICRGKLVAGREIADLRRTRRVVFVRKFSFDALADVPRELDFAFIDGDHSLDAIARDWADWSPRVTAGGIMALHDTLVPPHNPGVAALGSCRYYESHIRHDDRFEIVEQVHSLTVLRRKPV